MTDETFAVSDPSDHDDSTALFTGGPGSERVSVRFPAGAAWVGEILDLRVREQDDAGFVGEFEVTGTAWLENLLLRTGGEVIKPASLVGLGADAAARALAQYQ